MKSNEPAFPVTERYYTGDGQYEESVSLGLTKREWFAGMAMQGYIESNVCFSAEDCYKQADAMLEERDD